MPKQRRHLIAAGLLALGAAGLTACGQTGPLYLPTTPDSNKPSAAPPQAALEAGSAKSAAAPAQ